MFYMLYDRNEGLDLRNDNIPEINQVPKFSDSSSILLSYDK